MAEPPISEAAEAASEVTAVPPFDPRANRNSYWAAVFAEALVRAGVMTVCISPGSRSTPLALALATHAGLTAHSHIDERSAAFFALGHAKATGRPVALLCTSGTAAANFHPALIEARHAGVPLIVLTADRPPELRDTGAGQTIDQIKLYGDTVKWFLEAGTPELSPDSLRQLAVWAARAVYEATRAPAGPVHLNFPFRKPLEPTPVPGDVPEALGGPAQWAGPAAGAPFARGAAAIPAPDPAAVRRVADLVRRANRGLIVCGPMPPAPTGPADPGAPPWPEAAAALARRTGYPLLAEPPSGLRSGPHDQSHVIAHGEALLRGEAFRRELAPELLIRFGSPPTARHVEVLLGEHPDCPVVVVEPGGRWLEPTHHPTELIAAEEGAFAQALMDTLGPLPASRRADWLARFRDADAAAGEAIAALLAEPEGEGAAWSEPRVFHELAPLLPTGTLQITASSMPVRDLDAVTPPTRTRVRHLVNRGANGIDGTLSIALGAAAGQGDAPAVLVTGDLAFLHDANGLLAARHHPERAGLTVILLNNDGGGIFDMLPIADYGEPFERHFITPHGTDFAALCAAHGIAHVRPADWAQFREQVRTSLDARETRVIEVRTERRLNLNLRRRLWAAVAERLNP